jgi:hypothetical protein
MLNTIPPELQQALLLFQQPIQQCDCNVFTSTLLAIASVAWPK